MAPKSPKDNAVQLTFDGHHITVNNYDKKLYPAFTKAQVIDYYVQVAPFMLPHLKERPVTLKRYPNGIFGPVLYEKDAPGFTPAWVKTFPVPRHGGGQPINYIVINNVATLAWAASIATLEFHPFLHRIPAIDSPSYVVFDLDPGEPADIFTCAEVGFLLKQMLEELHLESFVKVSGSRGLQMYVPLNTPVAYGSTQAFARTIAEHLAEQHPKLVVAEMAKNKRTGRVFIDWSQNADFKTTVGVYSWRATEPRPYVSLPVTWEELHEALRRKELDKLYFDPASAQKRLQHLGDLFAPLLRKTQTLPDTTPKTSKRVSVSRTPEPLDEYRRKRNFAKTPEPAPSAPRASRQGERRRFVIQKHAANHLHYDFRLEMHGVLKSWAVPKGLPYALNEKRLAMATEDHPLEYLDFEGTIPKGEYGGGTVMVWDIGTYEIVEGSPYAGKLHLFLEGKKLRGHWMLIRRDQEAGKNWLVIKITEDLKPLSAAQDDSSVLTKRSLTQIAHDNDAQWHSNRPAGEARVSPRPSRIATPSAVGINLNVLPKAGRGFIEPMLAAPVAKLPAGKQWQYEVKLDGYRALALRDRGGVTLWSRRQHVLNKRFPSIVTALSKLDDGTMLDGEIVGLDEHGHPSFNLLQNHQSKAAALVFYAFDILAYQGKSVLALPLHVRQDLLRRALDKVSYPVRLSEPLHAEARAVVAAAQDLGLEGVVAKRVNSSYEPGTRTGAWVKYKLNQGQEFVIGGYVLGKHYFDALLVGYYEQDELFFVAKIRNGFTPYLKAQVAQRLRALATTSCPFANLPEPANARRGLALTATAMKQCRWVKPRLVTEIHFTEWTEDNHLRHAKFVALRDDKKPREVTRDR